MLQIEFDLIIAATAACYHTVTRTGTISTGLIWYLLMNPGSAFTTLLILFLQCNDPLAIQQHDEKVVLGHYSWNEWTP